MFVANILGIERRGGVLISHAGVPPSTEPVSQRTIPEKNLTKGGGLRTDFFEKPLKVLGFSFTLGNSKQNKASTVETPQNCVTLHRYFKA